VVNAMAGSILFPMEPHWTIGSHGFFPILDRIRAAVPETGKQLIEPLFEPLDQGFQFLALDGDVSQEAFNAFYQVAEREYRRCIASEPEARMPEGFYAGIMDCWADLIKRLEADPRCRPESDSGAGTATSVL
jgi:hypothetical protein